MDLSACYFTIRNEYINYTTTNRTTMNRIQKTAIISGMLTFGLCMSAATAMAQTKKAPAKKSPVKTATAGKTAGFKKLPGGIEYKIIKDAPGKNAAIGDIVKYNFTAKVDTIVLYDSRVKEGKPHADRIEEAKGPGQYQAVLPMLSAGDSAIVLISCDTILSTIPPDRKEGLPSWLKKGNKVKMSIAVVAVMSMDDFKKEMDAEALVQAQTDDKILSDYLAKNNIKATRTASGLYYTIEKEGTGPNIQNGQSVTMNYTGKTLDGQVFDSNVDSAFQHVAPFDFVPGRAGVIKGWEEGALLLKKGTKATLYIPSPMAYGAQSPSPSIPANSILVFNVEAVDVKAAEDNPQGTDPGVK